MKKSNPLILISLLPSLALASTGDATFSDITNQISGYLTGSLGMVFVMLGFMGAAAAIAGFAPMKAMFPVFGLTLALHYGPKILQTIFGASGDLPIDYLHHVGNFTLSDLLVIMFAGTIFVVGGVKYSKETEQ